MLKVKDLEVGYDGATVLHRLNMEVGKGQVVCVMGRNGVGKTTLLKSIMGLLRPTHGSIELDGVGHDAHHAR